MLEIGRHQDTRQLSPHLFCCFVECESLESIVIPESVNSEKGGENCFEGCKNLKSARLSQDQVCVLDGYFEDCTSLQHVEIPDNLKWIGCEAFLNCTSLESIDIPINLEAIYEYAFQGCTNLKHIRIGAKTEIADTAFLNCPNVVIQRVTTD